jgi:RNA polymerase sigma factor (TIGR02999 family)
MAEVTVLLERLNVGDAAAFDELVPLVYQELRAKARHFLASQPAGHTLQPTALVHEAFLKMAGRGGVWQGSPHFYNAAAEVMRQVLVSHARAKRARKRSDGRRRVDVADVPALADTADADGPDWEALDAALTELRQRDERRYRVVMLRYFAGLTDAQAAEALGVSEKTVERDWATARVFLRSRMEPVTSATGVASH